ncbi:MAG: nitroreductase [Erysipelotrichaceae bacterium]|nr:nitroreductase [Erysipelotrichaceae bacterium]
MELIEAIEKRHSVRQYKDAPIEKEKREILDGYASLLSKQGDLNIQVLYEEPSCFDSRLAHYGKFKNVKNYAVIAGKKDGSEKERAGYYGELFVLKAQTLGLNSCWAALTHGKSKAALKEGEKEIIVIALGYGENDGVPHKNKDVNSLAPDLDKGPEWFRKGVDAAMKAPTAVNQQKFSLKLLEGNRVKASAVGLGTLLKLDLGIVKCHFEIGAGKENFKWA